MISTLVILAVLMLAAIILGLAEIFFFPGITLAGIGGILCAGGGLYFYGSCVHAHSIRWLSIPM